MTTRMLAAIVTLSLCTVAAISAAQSSPPPPPNAPAAKTPGEPIMPPAPGPNLPPVTPAQVERIRRALNHPPGLVLDDRQLRFYLEIVARQPTFAEYAKGFDFVNGPTKGGNPMSHQEFLTLVTPKEFYSTAGITPLDQVQLAFTNWLGQSLIKKAMEELSQAKTDREVQEIRERINRELDALTGVQGK